VVLVARARLSPLANPERPAPPDGHHGQGAAAAFTAVLTLAAVITAALAQLLS
jgi:hypothetical protein